jgi:hypothetical protein
MRNCFTYAVLLFCIGFTNHLSAQKKNADVKSEIFRHATVLYFSDNLNLTFQKTVAINLSSSQKPASLHFSPGSVKDLPFFCALEYRMHQHTNLWIKFRTGNDESYMNMIRSTEK